MQVCLIMYAALVKIQPDWQLPPKDVWGKWDLIILQLTGQEPTTMLQLHESMDAGICLKPQSRSYMMFLCISEFDSLYLVKYIRSCALPIIIIVYRWNYGTDHKSLSSSG